MGPDLELFSGRAPVSSRNGTHTVRSSLNRKLYTGSGSPKANALHRRLRRSTTLTRNNSHRQITLRPISVPDFEPFRDGQTAGFLHTVKGRTVGSLVLTHGAGSNCESPLLVSVAEAFQLAGYQVLRCDLPFRQARRLGPPHPSRSAADREGLRAAVAALQRVTNGPVCLGGHSYGGRQASILATEEPESVHCLLLLSYPLHPPGKPEQLRTAHFPNLRIPALFVHGDADQFGTVAEMESVLTQLRAPHRLSVIKGAGHDLKRGKFDLSQMVMSPFAELRSNGLRAER